MILREIKNIYIKNRLTEGVDFVMKEWLKGTGGCYIDTLINPAWNDQLSATAKANGQPTDRWAFILYASGSESGIYLSTDRWWVESNTPSVMVSQRVAGNTDNISFSAFPATAEIYLSLKVTNNATPTYSCKINGVAWSGNVNGSNIITTLPDSTYKIGKSSSGLDVLKLKNVNINSHNFTPCQLLKSIPATLDANNKARAAGECGMYDSISGKFFGNVSSSGTFTVEGDVTPETHSGLQQIYQNKLIEGEDYIKGDYFQSLSSVYQSIVYAPSGINNFVMDLQAPAISTACFRIAPKKWFGALHSNNITFGGINSDTGSGGALWFQFTNKTMRFSHTKGIPTVNVKIINGAISETDNTISSGTDYQFNDYNKMVNDSLGFECKNCYFRPVELNGIPVYCIKTLHKIPAKFSFYGNSIPKNTFGILIERKIIPFLNNTLIMY